MTLGSDRTDLILIDSKDLNLLESFHAEILDRWTSQLQPRSIQRFTTDEEKIAERAPVCFFKTMIHFISFS